MGNSLADLGKYSTEEFIKNITVRKLTLQGRIGIHFCEVLGYVKNSVFEKVFQVFQADMIDRLCGKTNKGNEEEFVVYVDFVFVLIISK